MDFRRRALNKWSLFLIAIVNRFNPRVYRKIIYSGMGLKKGVFDPRERSDLSKYQLEFGISQLNKLERFIKSRKKIAIL